MTINEHKIDIPSDNSKKKQESTKVNLANNLDTDNNIVTQLSKINENSTIRQTRYKFQSIEEADENNTYGNINTDSPEHNSGDAPTNIQTGVYEFSISTLDRKLKEIKNYKKDKYKKKRRHSLSDNSGNHNEDQRLSNLNHEPFSERVSNITIMMNPSKLINDHLNEIQLRIIGHTRAAIMYEKQEKVLGYPVTILSSFITSAIMMSITSDDDHNKDAIKYISLSLSILSFLFSVSRDYLNFARKFQSHDLSSKLYTTLLRSTEVRLIKNHLTKEDKRDIFKDIVDQISIIEQYETPIPGKIDKKIRKDNVLMNS